MGNEVACASCPSCSEKEQELSLPLPCVGASPWSAEAEAASSLLRNESTRAMDEIQAARDAVRAESRRSSAAVEAAKAATAAIPSKVAQLARAEIRYTARSRLLWGALFVHAFLAWAPRLSDTVRGQITVADEYSLWDHLVATPLVVAAFLVGNAAALRETTGGASEMFAAAPAGRWDRTVGVLAGALLPAVMALAVVTVQAALIAADGGLAFGDPPFDTRLTRLPSRCSAFRCSPHAASCRGSRWPG